MLCALDGPAVGTLNTRNWARVPCYVTRQELFSPFEVVHLESANGLAGIDVLPAHASSLSQRPESLFLINVRCNCDSTGLTNVFSYIVDAPIGHAREHSPFVAIDAHADQYFVDTGRRYIGTEYC